MKQIINLYTQYINVSVRCNDGDLRIVGSSMRTSGLLEFCLGEQWVGVCDTNWNNADAGVACYQLGYSPYGNPRLLKKKKSVITGFNLCRSKDRERHIYIHV